MGIELLPLRIWIDNLAKVKQKVKNQFVKNVGHLHWKYFENYFKMILLNIEFETMKKMWLIVLTNISIICDHSKKWSKSKYFGPSKVKREITNHLSASNKLQFWQLCWFWTLTEIKFDIDVLFLGQRYMEFVKKNEIEVWLWIKRINFYRH